MILGDDTKEKVVEVLTKHEASRDDDNRLLATIWWADFNAQAYILADGELSGVRKFLKLLAAGKLSNPESVRRHRQKLQESCKELRGSKYNERKRELEAEVRQSVLNYRK